MMEDFETSRRPLLGSGDAHFWSNGGTVSVELTETAVGETLLSGPSSPRPSLMRNLRGVLKGDYWGREGAKMHHHYDLQEQEKLRSYESVDYLPPNSAAYRHWLRRQSHRRMWDRWLVVFLIGFAIALVAFMLFSLTQALAGVRINATRALLHAQGAALSCLVTVVMVVAMVGIAAGAVVLSWGKATGGGSGVPEVMALLNGVHVAKMVNIWTFSVKMVSCMFSVASGLPVGPEGPMIHLGAIIGFAVSQMHSTTLNLDLNIFKRFRNHTDRRDFVTIGVAAGVAAAFHAPIGGLLFALEEMSSFWDASMGVFMFAGNMVGLLVLNVLDSSRRTLFNGSRFGLFVGGTFKVNFEVSNHLGVIPSAALLGILCGLSGMVFSGLHKKIAKAREGLLKGRRWAAFAEPCIIGAVFIVGALLLPAAFRCVPVRCLQAESGELECWRGLEGVDWGDRLTVVTPPSLETYTCLAAQPTAIQPNTTYLAYNELASLTIPSGEDTIRLLLQRGAPQQFGYGALAVMLGWYFGGAVLVAGSNISSGLFVPMLMMGSVLGRLLGLFVLDVSSAAAWRLPAEGDPEGNPWGWMDPGVMALLGAAGFMTGASRLTFSVAVILMEMCDDGNMLLSILVTVMFSRWTADLFSHSLYDSLLEVKCVPFLPSKPKTSRSLELVTVAAVMTPRPQAALERMRVSDLLQLLRGPHNAFPVVRMTTCGRVCTGSISREHLMVLLHAVHQNGVQAAAHITWEDLQRRQVAPLQEGAVMEGQRNVLIGSHQHLDHALHHPALQDQELDLRPLINHSVFKVQMDMSVERAYQLFRNFGLRHLPVVDDHNVLRGILTRQDLMPYRLELALASAAHEEPALEDDAGADVGVGKRFFSDGDEPLAALNGSSPSVPLGNGSGEPPGSGSGGSGGGGGGGSSSNGAACSLGSGWRLPQRSVSARQPRVVPYSPGGRPPPTPAGTALSWLRGKRGAASKAAAALPAEAGSKHSGSALAELAEGGGEQSHLRRPLPLYQAENRWRSVSHGSG